jgi:hypothetical protein
MLLPIVIGYKGNLAEIKHVSPERLMHVFPLDLCPMEKRRDQWSKVTTSQ